MWIFLIPVVCLFAVQEAKSLFNCHDIGMPLLLALQLVTILLTFTFQDFSGGKKNREPVFFLALYPQITTAD